MNDNLRHALTRARLHTGDVAENLGVDPKTVDRWLKGRVPHTRHRWALADLLSVQEADLWPEAAAARGMRTGSGELKAVYPHRWAIPRTAWQRLFETAKHEIGILNYSGLFLAEDTGVVRVLQAKAQQGVNVRILLGDPDSPHVAARGAEETIGDDVMSAKVRNALTLLRPLHRAGTAEIRLHATVLYNSIYRADDQILVNLHAYGTPASHAPVLHLHHTTDDDITTVYLDSFQRVWDNARPLD